MFKRLGRTKLERLEEILTNKEFEKFSRSQLQQITDLGYEFIKQLKPGVAVVGKQELKKQENSHAIEGIGLLLIYKLGGLMRKHKKVKRTKLPHVEQMELFIAKQMY